MFLASCERGDLSEVKSLLNSSHIEVKNSRGATGLSLCAKHGHLEILKILLSLGADVNTTDNVRFTQ